MHTLPFLQERIRQVFQGLQLPGFPPELYDPIVYSLFMGGKRIRPVLTLMACDMFGEDINKALYPAVGIEIFHNFTLVHDDIMDNAPIRRGKKTVYKKWDVNTAILSGDTMFALGYEYVAKVDSRLLPDVLNVFTTTAREVCEGQQLDMNFETMKDVTIGEYLDMIRLKTAVLLGCALKVGSLTGGAGKIDADYLYSFGENLGMAFQIQDDLLDTFGDEKTFGKKTGGDIAANKKTFLYIKALEVAPDRQKPLLVSCYNDNRMEEEKKIRLIKGIFDDLQIKELALKEIDRYYSRALTFMKKVSLPDQKKDLLKEYCDGLMQRTY
ncbi:MAG: polyprenyl synthetase family protein [Bacteroidetes bacterium]|nr:polyprenyl synthetase family protein [Bacteroidota bacterium]